MKVNLGSGQRRFDTECGWVNVDRVSRPGQVPDIICDVGKDRLPFDDGSVDMVVLHQVLEHFHLGPEVDSVLSECWRVLSDKGILLIFVPDIRALVQRWMTRQIDDYIFFVNLYGAWQGEEGDDHHWGWTGESLVRQLRSMKEPWYDVHAFNWRTVAGADFARDWWVCSMEAIK